MLIGENDLRYFRFPNENKKGATVEYLNLGVCISRIFLNLIVDSDEPIGQIIRSADSCRATGQKDMRYGNMTSNCEIKNDS